MEYLLVALGGAVGSVGRYGIGQALQGILGDFPVGTFAANVIAGFIIGFVTGLAGADIVSARGKLLLTTGLCGGLSTFSTFSLETVGLMRDGVWGMATLSVLLNVAVCCASVLAGMWVSARVSACAMR